MYEFLKMVFGFGILAYGFEFEDFRVVSGRQTQTSIAIALNPINTEACLTPRFRGMGFGALGLALWSLGCRVLGFGFPEPLTLNRSLNARPQAIMGLSN